MSAYALSPGHTLQVVKGSTILCENNTVEGLVILVPISGMINRALSSKYKFFKEHGNEHYYTGGEVEIIMSKVRPDVMIIYCIFPPAFLLYYIRARECSLNPRHYVDNNVR